MEHMDITTAFVEMGSNLGAPESNLAAARLLLQADGLAILAESSVYLTEPWGLMDQPWFANQVLKIRPPAGMTPEGLLDALNDIENRMGRMRSPDPNLRYGPRIIDLDILLIDDIAMTTDRLTLPHGHLKERAFELVPLLELAPDLVLPDGTKAADALAVLEYTLNKNMIFQ